MKCTECQKQLFESPLGDLSPELLGHLKSCSECEREYLRLVRMEALFVRQTSPAPHRSKTRSYVFGFGASLAVACFVWFKPVESPITEIAKNSVEIPVSEPSEERRSFSEAPGVEKMAFLAEKPATVTSAPATASVEERWAQKFATLPAEDRDTAHIDDLSNVAERDFERSRALGMEGVFKSARDK